MWEVIANLLFTATFIYGFIHLIRSFQLGGLTGRVYILLQTRGTLSIKQIAGHLNAKDRDVFRACFGHPKIHTALLGSYDRWEVR